MTVSVPFPGRSGLIAEAIARRPPAPRLVSSSVACSLTVAFSPRNIARVGGGHVAITVPRLPGGTVTLPVWIVSAVAVPAHTRPTIAAAMTRFTRLNLADAAVELEVHGGATRPNANTPRLERASPPGGDGIPARLEGNAVTGVSVGLHTRDDLAAP